MFGGSALLSSVKCRLTFFAVIAMIPLLGLTFYVDLKYRNHEEFEAKREIETTAGLLAFNVEKTVEGARQLLVAASQTSEINGQSRNLCKGYVARLTEKFPQYDNILVVRPNGAVLCSGLPYKTQVHLADRSYFRRTLSTGRFSMGDFQVGRITHKPSINFGYPLRDKSGKLQGVAVVALDLAWLNRSLEMIGLPNGSAVGVVDRNGTFIAHYPDASKWIGKSITGAYPNIQWTGGGRKFLSEARGNSDITSYLTFSPVHTPDGDLYAMVSISKAAVIARQDRMLLISPGIVGAIFILALVLAATYGRLTLVQPINRLLEVTRRIEGGDFGARVGAPYGPGEFGRLGKALDDMSTSLENDLAERAMAADFVKEREAMLRSFFDSPGAMRGIAAVVNRDIRFLSGNGAAAEFFGYSKESFQDKSGETTFPREFVTLWLERFEESRQAGKPVSFEFSHGEGTEKKWLSAMVSSLGTAANAAARFGFVMHDITEKKRNEAQIEQQLRRLAALRDIDMAITSSLDMRVMMRVIIGEVISQLNVDAADILLINPHEMTLEYALGLGFRTNALSHSRLPLGEGHAGRAALARKTIRVSPLTLSSDGFGRSRELPKEEFVDYIAVPLISKGHVKGVLEIFNRTPLDVDREWLDFLEALGTQSAIAIDNAEMYNDLELSHAELILAYNTTLEGWSRALDYRDKETEGHSKRVTDLTVATARAMGMSDAELVHVRRGALLHDIGKLGVPDSILLKPGKLTDEEWKIMKQHPVIAYELLSPITFLKEAVDIPYCHHEKWDGTGYPRGLRAEQIPPAARIFALVDVWDALRSDRPYRPAWTNDMALEYITNNAGTHFDPDVVPIFLNLIEKI
jgi:PAS domain S-box-containing protein/putative nucleotidyltransferase with HDIG domain